MSSFTDFSAPLSIQYDPEASKALGADHWRVKDSFRFYIGSPESGEWVYVPSGYLTDGASVPRALWAFIPPWSIYGQAAVVHDIVCEYLSITKDGAPHRVTRKVCDDILMQAMEVIGVPWLTRQVIHKAVSLYRVTSGTDSPTNTPLKRKLESNWST